MRVHIVIQNLGDDRVLPRFARHLMEHNGWTANRTPNPSADINYYFAYFEYRRQHVDGVSAAYMTHREEDGSAKAKAYDEVASRVNLRVLMNDSQVKHSNKFGKSVVIPLPLETEAFTIVDRPSRPKPLCGVAGYTYRSGRKGESLFSELKNALGDSVYWQASGRGWPVACKMRQWSEMPGFYHTLDLFICTSLIEGGPMTTLEALATGCPVVIPDDVGIHSQLPDVHGIYMYKTGDVQSLAKAARLAVSEIGTHDRNALRAATKPHSVRNWCEGNRKALESLLYDRRRHKAIKSDGKRGIYVVAFGEPARAQAVRCISSARKHMPDVPVALCSDRPLGPETVLIQQKDKDIGGRIAKLKAYDLAPADWDYVLYVDADTEFVQPVYFMFDLVSDGWEFVICKDAHLHDTIKDFQRRNNAPEFNETVAKLGTFDALQINGGVWAFRRCSAAKEFFDRWFTEWSKYKGRDQGALIRAMYEKPIKTYWLGNEWNTMITLKGKEYPPGRDGTAGILHHVGTARRWRGQVPNGYGLTDDVAWEMVDKYMRGYNAKSSDR